MLHGLLRRLGYIPMPPQPLGLGAATQWLRDNGVLVDTEIPAERLEQLRHAVMRQWEESLIIDGSNDMNRVPFGMVAGLIDVARAAEQLYQDASDEANRAYLRRRLDDYLRDVNALRLRSARAR